MHVATAGRVPEVDGGAAGGHAEDAAAAALRRRLRPPGRAGPTGFPTLASGLRVSLRLSHYSGISVRSLLSDVNDLNINSKLESL